MAYYLLTGATGLLGRYLLRNLLLRGVRVAVVVRPTRLATAAQRIESAVGEIEEATGRSLDRPVVLEGELTEPELGLSPDDRRWARRYVRGILHNAASLSFQTGSRDEEPWLSNVRGTQHMLELARQSGIRELHHVSTAYVCGLRTGVVREDELDVGQEHGNDYERSKLQAEQLVRDADWLDSLTIYRPAIIVGDSQTYFTNTFHGFYTPLQIVHAAINKLSLSEIEPRSLVEVLGLAGHERKNLVPVDWVAEAIARLVTDGRHHRRTYHLTTDTPTPVSLLCEVFARAVLEHSINWEQAAAGGAGTQSFAVFQRLFRQQMSVYQAYWRDDPQFDATQRRAALPALACPALDERALANLCQFAIKNKFWWSRGQRVEPPLDVGGLLAQRLSRDDGGSANRLRPAAGLVVAGCGGGQWQLLLEEGLPTAYEPGVNERHAGVLHVHVDVLRSIARGELAAAGALACGAIAVEGTGLSLPDAERIVQWLAEQARAWSARG